MQLVTSRASFLRRTSTFGAGLALATVVPRTAFAADVGPPRAGSDAYTMNTWVHIRPDGDVIVMLGRSEMGQGVATGLPMLVAEELDVPLARTHFQFADAEPQYYFEGNMSSGGSRSMQESWEPLRTAGAAARAMLIAAAAKRWNVDPSTCGTNDGVVTSGTHSAAYGELVEDASKLPVPDHVTLKDPKDFKLIGTRTARLDVPAKVRGAARYGIDVRLPGMVFASIERPPTFGGSVASLNDAAARKVHGVLDVVRVPSGVAVVATNTWAAFHARTLLQVTWKDGVTASSPQLFADAERLARGASTQVLQRGELAENGGTTIEAVYRGPFLAHAAMEPMNATAHVTDSGVEVWAPTQAPSRGRDLAAKAAGVAPEKVKLHVTFLGGGFGRRLQNDYVEDAVAVAKAIRKPVQVIWNREDDIKHDFYRPMSVDIVRATVNDGRITAWEHRVAQSQQRMATNNAIPDYYALPNVRLLFAEHDHGVPVGSLRAPGANWSYFVSETMMDELAHAAKHDPLAFRIAHLSDPRMRKLAQTVGERAWDKPLPGTTQGVAFAQWGRTMIALVADCAMQGNTVQVHRVVAAIDCGMAVNPDLVTMQVEGAVNYAIAMSSTAKITLAQGRVEQNNFYDYTVLRMPAAPRVDVVIVPSGDHPWGVGEIGVPATAPAIANAVFRATGKRVRTLPFSEALA